jgi:hypothetical protein
MPGLQGPQLGEALTKARNAWTASAGELDRAALLDIALAPKG